MDKRYDYCIVGAGPAGLTLAYQLLKGGKSVLLLERDARVGGLSKSFTYGEHVFDIGPKRFHTDDPIVLEFITQVLQQEAVTIDRSSKVNFLGAYFNWPLKLSDLFKMRPSVALRCFIDLLRKPAMQNKSSFREYIISRYGRTLYSLFFEPYTRKFLRWDPEQIHSDWAMTGINRTVIDKNVKANALIDLIRSVLLPQKIETKFLYPKSGGFGHFFEKLFGLCQTFPHFTVRLNDEITQLEKKEWGVEARTKRGETIAAQALVWSGNLNNLMGLIALPEKRLHYLNTVFYNIVCRREGLRPGVEAQWIYVSQGDSLISRVTCMREFAAHNCPPGYSNLICEVTDSQSAPKYFPHPEKYTIEVVTELVTLGFIKDQSCVESVFTNPVRDTYPIYHQEYRQAFNRVTAALKAYSPHIHLLGRTGAYWYNNSDHSIRMSIDMANYFLKKTDKPLNFRSYFGSDQEAA